MRRLSLLNFQDVQAKSDLCLSAIVLMIVQTARNIRIKPKLILELPIVHPTIQIRLSVAEAVPQKVSKRPVASVRQKEALADLPVKA